MYENIPQELITLHQWVTHKNKHPKNPKKVDLNASTTDPNTWGTFGEALQALNSGIYDGIGFVFNNNGIVGIDLDDCRDPQTGEIHPEALKIIKSFNSSYTEISPSGRGFHIYVYGDIPEARKDSQKQKGFIIEMYKVARFFTVTGNRYGDVKSLSDCSKAVSELYNNLFLPKPAPVCKPVTQIGSDLLQAGLKKDPVLISLWNGDRPHGNESSDDQALMNKLAYWDNCDRERMKVDFLNSPHAQGKDPSHYKKVQRRDYLDRTANTAIRSCTSTAANDSNKYYMERQKQMMVKDSTSAVNIEQTNPVKDPIPINRKEKKPFQVFTAVELGEMDLKPPDFIVNGLLPVGITILAAPSKIGKSWLAMDLSISVAKGKPFLGSQTNQAGVLYLALEDSLHRIKLRMDKLLQGEAEPLGLNLSVEAPNMVNGLIGWLDDFLKEHQAVKLIIIDTFQKIKPPSDRTSTAYEADYRHLSEFKKLAGHYNVCILLVHHTKKNNGSDGDVFEKILGSTALQGATDTMMVISKKERTNETATLAATGRDISQQELVIKFDKERCRWINEGTVEDVENRKSMEEYDSDHLVTTIRMLTSETDLWEGSLEELKQAVSKHTRQVLPESGKALSARIAKLAPLLAHRDNIEHRQSDHPVRKGSTSSRLHSFQKYHPI